VDRDWKLSKSTTQVQYTVAVELEPSPGYDRMLRRNDPRESSHWVPSR
jgi:hypothetical protein